MNKGTPEQFKEALEARIAELSNGTVESATAVKAGWAASEDTSFWVEDGSMGEVGDILTYDDVKQMFFNLEGDPVVDEYHGDFDSWLYDTINSGYLQPINAATNTCNISGKPVFGYDDDDDFAGDWVELDSKSVQDSDGFWTDYTLYRYDGDPSDVEYPYLCMFGDKDLYEPDEGYADWSGETEEEAWDWFENYHGFEDDDDIGYTTDAPIKSSGNPEDYLNDINDDYIEPDIANLSQSDLDRLYEIIDKYNTSYPVSGDWGTETVHEQRTIADEFGISMEAAKQIMIDILGFEPDMFDEIESCSNINCDIDLSEYDYAGNQNGYQLYRKIVDGKGQWVAQDQDEAEPPFAITYEQARGYEPIIRTDMEQLRYDMGKQLFGSTDTNCQCTATQIVKDIYNQFPEVEFLDERDLGESVRLKFNVPKTFDRHAELEAYLNNCGCPYTLLNTVLRVDAPEDDFYKIDSCDILASNPPGGQWYYNNQPRPDYWYFTTHGAMPGSWPEGANVLDIIDTPNGSYVHTDKLLKTEALQEFDLKERWPSDELIAKYEKSKL